MKCVSLKEEYLGGNIIYVPFTILGNRTLIFGFHLAQTNEFTFLYQSDRPVATIARHINNLPVALDYFKQRLYAQNNRKIIHSWVMPLNDSTSIVGVPFDFDASLTDRVKKALDREKFIMLSRTRILPKEDMIRSYLLKPPERGGEIYPELLTIRSPKSILTIEDIPTMYVFRNSWQVKMPCGSNGLLLPLEFDIKFIPYTYEPYTYGSFARVHLLLINPEALRILVTTFDDSRMSLIGGTRMANESILDSVIRECREESKDLLKLDKEELGTARYFYCVETKHIVAVLYTARDFVQLAHEYDKLPLSRIKENYGFRSLRIQDFLRLPLGSFGPNVLSFIHWCRTGFVM